MNKINNEREPLKITKLYCYNCGHIWKPRIEYLPISCPLYKTTKWRGNRMKNKNQRNLDGVLE